MLNFYSFKQTFKDSTWCSTWLQPPITWNIISNTYVIQIRLALAHHKVNFKAHLATKFQDLQLNQWAMAPPNKAISYYCELCDRTLVPDANLEEHKVGAIHRGLMEAFGKMMKCQLQVFREDLKVGRRKQKLFQGFECLSL